MQFLVGLLVDVFQARFHVILIRPFKLRIHMFHLERRMWARMIYCKLIKYKNNILIFNLYLIKHFTFDWTAGGLVSTAGWCKFSPGVVSNGEGTFWEESQLCSSSLISCSISSESQSTFFINFCNSVWGITWNVECGQWNYWKSIKYKNNILIFYLYLIQVLELWRRVQKGR